jgi:hypothetical protein
MRRWHENPDERTRELARAVDANPDDPMLRATYARALMREGDATAAHTQAVQAMRSALPLITHGEVNMVGAIADTARLPHRSRHPLDVLRSLFGPGEIVAAWISGLKTKKARTQAFRDLWEPVYVDRRDRLTHPHGYFEGRGDRTPWYPYEDEDAGGDVTQVRSPSSRWPYSYMLRARTKDHCKHLVERAFHGHDVPPDVALVMRAQARRIIKGAWPRVKKLRYNPRHGFADLAPLA